MKWYLSGIDDPPKNGQEVLVSVDGSQYLAVYDTDKKIYRVEGEEKETFFEADTNIYWTKYARPVES